MSIFQHDDLHDAKALAEIKRMARRDRIVLTGHARRRMGERAVSSQDIRKALLTATMASYQDDRDTWRLDGGVDIDGDDLMLICSLEDDVIVVTLF